MQKQKKKQTPNNRKKNGVFVFSRFLFGAAPYLQVVPVPKLLSRGAKKASARVPERDRTNVSSQRMTLRETPACYRVHGKTDPPQKSLAFIFFQIRNLEIFKIRIFVFWFVFLFRPNFCLKFGLLAKNYVGYTSPDPPKNTLVAHFPRC